VELADVRISLEAANERLKSTALELAAARDAFGDARAQERRAVEEAAELRGGAGHQAK
jgi:hypothetical protein